MPKPHKIDPHFEVFFGISGSPGESNQQRDTVAHIASLLSCRIASQQVLFNYLKEKLQNFLTCLIATFFVLLFSFLFAMRGKSSNASVSNYGRRLASSKRRVNLLRRAKWILESNLDQEGNFRNSAAAM